MRLDPAVARRKFAREVARVEAQRSMLRRWGCCLVESTFPYVDTVFVPSKPMHLVLSRDRDRAKGRVRDARRQPQQVPLELSMFSARAFGVRLDLTDFDQRPPGVSFRDPFTWDPLPFAQLPPGHYFDGLGNALPVVRDVHPHTRAPFLCMRGTREYHEHPQHTGDDWALYRSDYGLFTVLSSLWRICIEHVRPSVTVSLNGQARVLWNVGQVS